MNEDEEPTTPSVTLGFPNAGLDASAVGLDLNALVVTNPTATFYMRLDADTWADFGFNRGDIIVIDRSRTPKKHDLVVAVTDGDFTILHYEQINTEIIFWGVVTYVIKKVS